MTQSRRRDAGMVTAELAVAIPGVAFVLALCLAGIATAIDQVRCVDAARLASRAAARGDTVAAVQALGLRAAPANASVTVTQGGGDAVVTVEAPSGGWGGLLPTWRLSATARTPVESPP